MTINPQKLYIQKNIYFTLIKKKLDTLIDTWNNNSLYLEIHSNLPFQLNLSIKIQLDF